MGVGSSSVTAGQALGTVGDVGDVGEGVGSGWVLGLGWALDADADAEAVAVVVAECRECWRR
jgi:hypothetical protein